MAIKIRNAKMMGMTDQDIQGLYITPEHWSNSSNRYFRGKNGSWFLCKPAAITSQNPTIVAADGVAKREVVSLPEGEVPQEVMKAVRNYLKRQTL